MNKIGPHFELVPWVLLVCSAVFVADAAGTPESGAAAPHLLYSPSIRSNGMGQVGVALADGLGGYYNAATPAMVAKDHFFGTVNYLGRMKVIPGLASDIDFGYNAVQFGWNSAHWNRVRSGGQTPGAFSYSVALAYYRTKANFGTQYRTDAQGNDLGTFHSYGEADNYVFSIGGHYLVDLGFGVALKRITEELAGTTESSGPSTATARDLGIQARFPVVEIVERLRGRDMSIANRWHMRLDLAAGIAWSNRGEEMTFPDEDQTDPLPAHRRIGVASLLGVCWKKDRVEWDVLKLIGAYEKLTPQIRGSEVPGASDSMGGIELSFCDVLSIRRGKYDDEDGNRHVRTSGYTLRSDGILRLFQILARQESQENKWLDFIADHFSISWTEFSQDSDSGFQDTSHAEFRILF